MRVILPLSYVAKYRRDIEKKKMKLMSGEVEI